jgi:hypothetical protein
MEEVFSNDLLKVDLWAEWIDRSFQNNFILRFVFKIKSNKLDFNQINHLI